MGVLGDRVRERLRLLDKTQEQFAKATGYTQPGVNDIMSGKVERPRRLLEIANFLLTTQEYLLGRTNDPSPRPGQSETESAGVVVPIINWVSAGRLANPEAPLAADDAMTILVDGLGHGDFFGLTVQGDSMDRVSPEGSTIIVNRAERNPISGKAYIFAVRGDVTYKLWHPRPLYLAPFSTNPRNEPIFVEKKRDLEVIGRVRRTLLDL